VDTLFGIVWQSYIYSPITWVVFIFGALIGSFLNVCIFRIPSGTFWKSHRSVCPHCGAGIPFYLNIPILGWLLIKGRARCCKSRLSVQYPAVELLTACIFVLFYWKFAFVKWSNGTIQFDPADLIRFVHAIVLSSLLIVCSVIDLRHFIIPDVISLPMIVLSPLVAYLHPELDYLSSFIGVLAGGFSLYAIAWIYWLVKREIGMGMGDVKLLAAMGGWLGYQSVIPTIFYGSILGAVIGITIMLFSRKMTLKSAVPFGPFLAVGGLLHLYFGSSIQEILFLGTHLVE
jgi:leader peptidase (prepilin peptidase)/N-methyltransferase